MKKIIEEKMKELDGFIQEFSNKTTGKANHEIALIAWQMAQEYRSKGYSEGWSQALDSHGVEDRSEFWDD